LGGRGGGGRRSLHAAGPKGLPALGGREIAGVNVAREPEDHAVSGPLSQGSRASSFRPARRIQEIEISQLEIYNFVNRAGADRGNAWVAWGGGHATIGVSHIPDWGRSGNIFTFQALPLSGVAIGPPRRERVETSKTWHIGEGPRLRFPPHGSFTPRIFFATSTFRERLILGRKGPPLRPHVLARFALSPGRGGPPRGKRPPRQSWAVFGNFQAGAGEGIGKTPGPRSGEFGPEGGGPAGRNRWSPSVGTSLMHGACFRPAPGRASISSAAGRPSKFAPGSRRALRGKRLSAGRLRMQGGEVYSRRRNSAPEGGGTSAPNRRSGGEIICGPRLGGEQDHTKRAFQFIARGGGNRGGPVDSFRTQGIRAHETNSLRRQVAQKPHGRRAGPRGAGGDGTPAPFLFLA